MPGNSQTPRLMIDWKGQVSSRQLTSTQCDTGVKVSQPSRVQAENSGMIHSAINSNVFSDQS